MAPDPGLGGRLGGAVVVAETPAELWARAEAAGVEIQHRDCSLCGAERAFAYPDPLDLSRLRESKGYTKTSFANRLRKPDGSRVTIGFVHMVENPDLAHRDARRCPDWLLEQYLSMPPAGAPKKGAGPRKGQALASLQECMQKAILAGQKTRQAKARRQRELEKLNPPKAGSLWRMLNREPKRVIEVVKVMWPTILYRVQGQEDGPLRSVGARSFLKGYEEITR